MPLSNRQNRTKARAELAALVTNLMSARRRNDAVAATAARQALIDFTTPFLDLADEAEDAVAAAILANLNHAMDELTEISARLGPFGEMFKTAQKVARQEKKELLIPQLSASAAQAVELFTLLHQSADTISEQLGEANDLAGVASALDNVLNELNALRDATHAASNS